MIQPPPPLPPPTLLGLGTMTLMIGITFLMQAIAIAFSSVAVREYRGVRFFFLSTLSMSVGYFLLLWHPQIGFAIGIASNFAIYTGNMLLYLSVCQFTETPYQRWVAYGLIPLGYLGLLLTFVAPLPILWVTESVNTPLSIASAYVLLKSDHRAYRLSAYVTAIPLVVYSLVSFARLIFGFLPQGAPGAGNESQAPFVLMVFILSFLWTAGFILMISQRLQTHLNELAMNDMLTRVRNRRAMHELLNYELRRAEREVKDFSIILLDVDHFKRVNDTYGHDVGDEVLKWMAQHLQLSSRIQDTVSRWGGEEFLILLPSTTLEEAVEVAERMRSHIENTSFSFKDVTVNVTFSAGVSFSREHQNVDKLCKVADAALYVAKRTRNRVVSQEQLSQEA
jgi:diguanylate cyclase (GGDEF)-like protein